ncbi:hypothetical protein CK934_12890 [Chitinophaga sp. MD30]|nr:hypothetical protein CK934_12890 [Chitinophaga sp. MD30]
MRSAWNAGLRFADKAGFTGAVFADRATQYKDTREGVFTQGEGINYKWLPGGAICAGLGPNKVSTN